MDDPTERPNGRTSAPPSNRSLLAQLSERGVLRVAGSYAVIAWLLLQIADVTFDPLGIPKWGMTALIVAALLGFPVAIALAWFYELGDRGISRDTAPSGEPRPVVHGKRHYADFVIIGVLLVTVAVLLVRQSDIGKPKPPENPAIAVLPFVNIGGDPEQEYFSDGLAQEVMDRLARVPGLVVTARSSSFSFKGEQVDAKTVAGKLGVTTVLEGSVRRAGNRLKLSAQLVDGASGQPVWSGSFDRELNDVFAVQEELAAAIIDAIVPAARGETVAKVVAPTSDLSAYDLYLLGRAAQEARLGGRAKQAVEYLEHAVQLDPKFAKAHAALSRALVLFQTYGFDGGDTPPPDTLARAEAAAYRALALDPDSSDARAALGTVLRTKGSPAAEAEYRRALELNPNNVAALYDLTVLISGDISRTGEADELMERMLRIDPRSGALWRARLHSAAELRDGGATFRQEFEKAKALLADDPDAMRLIASVEYEGTPSDRYLAAIELARGGAEMQALHEAFSVWLEAGDIDRADRMQREMVRLEPTDRGTLHRGVVIAGVRRDHDLLLRRLDELRSVHDEGFSHQIAAFWLEVMGRHEEAAAALAKAGPIPDGSYGPPGSAMLDGRQALPVVLRIYRATGRTQEADAMADKYFKFLQKQPSLDLAVLAANEGRKSLAVDTLRVVVSTMHDLRMFEPSFPWFKSLEGESGYDEVLAMREQRMSRIRDELLRLEPQAAGTVLAPK
jgi:TolB-like protein